VQNIAITPCLSVYLSISLCLLVRLSVRISKTHHAHISPNFPYILPAAVARSSSDCIAICYVLPVWWMTSCFHMMERMGQNQRRRECFVQFARWQQRGEVCYLRLRIVFCCNLHHCSAFVETASCRHLRLYSLSVATAHLISSQVTGRCISVSIY